MMQCYCFRSCATDALHDVAKWLNGEGMIAVRDIWLRTYCLTRFLPRLLVGIIS